MGWQNTLQAIKQFSLPRTRALEEELGTVRAEHAAVSAELDAVRDEFTQAHENDTQQIAALQLQLNHIESDRNNARQQAQLLEESLQQANSRQAGTEQRMTSLEAQLEESRNQHESNLYLTRDALTRLQSEQQNLLSLQSDMARTFHEVTRELLQSLQAQVKPRLSMLQMSFVASLLFLSGVLATALVLHDGRDARLDLSDVSNGIKELQVLMKTHFSTHEALLETLTQLINRTTSGEVMPDQGALSSVDDAGTRQANLLVLGFDVGKRQSDGAPGNKIAQALQSFQQLYLLEGEPDAVANAALQQHADVARADAKKFKIDSAILAAIRLANLRTGVEFSYLMELAAVESSFDPQARAKTSSASGLYQFKDKSWLDAIRAYGDSYGLGHYAAQEDYRLDDNGVMQPYIEDAALQQRVLDLRFNPRLAALLAAEHVRNSREQLVSSLTRQPGRTELYLTHFFGTSGAISFLKVLEENPDRIAGEIFPGPARRNRNIFQTRSRTPRTVAEVYRVLGRKFNTARYEEG
ncbi:MAG: transglycosylase SLT domain-containing protein [Gammaproteobacteria bacterium]|nr:transglycosylase SLT domain-containing protein [Gammaproteobacteria bacterium]